MYRVKLQTFEGPLDLLLFFIKRDELDIYDIPIAKITKEFLVYVRLMQHLDLEVAGEFILMAAELMQIKVKMLLPREEGEEEEQDPRADLVRRLLEYKRYKEMAEKFSGLEDEARKIYYRQMFRSDPKYYVPEDETLKDVTLFDLAAAFRYALEHIPKKIFHEIELINVTVDEQMDYINQFLETRAECTFRELVANMHQKIRIVVTFVALLEMIKNKIVGIRQEAPYEDFWILRSPAANLIALATE
ncbi:MAG: segregation/condensation protein A [Bacteroidota bacterium]